MIALDLAAASLGVATARERAAAAGAVIDSLELGPCDLLAAQAPGASRYAEALADVGRRYNGPAPAEAPAAAPGGAGAPAGGSPETVLGQVRELRDAIGAGVLDLILYNDALPHELARESVRLFGTEVIPRARDP